MQGPDATEEGWRDRTLGLRLVEPAPAAAEKAEARSFKLAADVGGRRPLPESLWRPTLPRTRRSFCL